MQAIEENQFLKDVGQHQIDIVRDDGLSRHIKFGIPGTRNMSFDLITWPGHLCYAGDMGTYVFNRMDDMFQFFRTDADSSWLKSKGLTLGINPRYWGEKLQSVDKIDGYKEFDTERFNEVIQEYLVGWIRSHRDSTTRQERRDLWDSVMFSVIEAEEDSEGYRKQVAAHDFSHRVNAKVGDFSFRDFSEYDCTKYSHRFMWCCYAVAWGVRSYDEACQERASESDRPREIMAR